MPQYLTLYISNFMPKAKGIKFSNDKINPVFNFRALLVALSGVISYHNGAGSSNYL